MPADARQTVVDDWKVSAGYSRGAISPSIRRYAYFLANMDHHPMLATIHALDRQRALRAKSEPKTGHRG